VKVLGDVHEGSLSEGFHILNPLAQVYDFNVRFQNATAEKAEGGTSDLQDVYEDITLNYEYDPAKVSFIYNHFGEDSDIEAKFIKPALYESFKAVTSNYTAEELVTKRAKFSSDVITQLQSKLTKYGIIVSDINVQNFHFDDQFADAVRRKVVAGQNRLTAEQELEAEKVKAQQQVVDAEAAAQARVIEAQSQAKAITVQTEAIQQQGGQAYLQLQSIKQWDGKLPQQWSGQSLPFVNFNNVTH
jgi:prohibitin 2